MTDFHPQQNRFAPLVGKDSHRIPFVIQLLNGFERMRHFTQQHVMQILVNFLIEVDHVLPLLPAENSEERSFRALGRKSEYSSSGLSW